MLIRALHLFPLKQGQQRVESRSTPAMEKGHDKEALEDQFRDQARP